MRVGIVNTEDISIVVQGPIVNNKDYYPNGWTNEALVRLRRFFPGSEIILSTWKGSNTDGLDFDILVLNDDPGYAVTSPKSKLPFNVNRQIVSASSGLKRASRKYAMKMRSDTIFKDNVILSYFGKYTSRTEAWKVFKERVVTFVARNPRRYYMPEPFVISDWLHFGLREDVVSLWDIPLAPTEFFHWFESHPRPKNFNLLYDPSITIRYGPEQYIWTTFLKKFGDISCEHIVDRNPSSIHLNELIVANNLVLLDFDMMGIEHLKFIGNKESGALDTYKLNEPKLKRFLEDLTQTTLSYNHYQWLTLYKKYCLGRLLHIPHFVYDIVNPLICNLYLSSKRIKKRFSHEQHH